MRPKRVWYDDHGEVKEAVVAEDGTIVIPEDEDEGEGDGIITEEEIEEILEGFEGLPTEGEEDADADEEEDASEELEEDGEEEGEAGDELDGEEEEIGAEAIASPLRRRASRRRAVARKKAIVAAARRLASKICRRYIRAFGAIAAKYLAAGLTFEQAARHYRKYRNRVEAKKVEQVSKGFHGVVSGVGGASKRKGLLPKFVETYRNVNGK
jgi:hypothetical protein